MKLLIFLSASLFLFPFASLSQRQMRVRAIDIVQQTDIRDFKLLIVHEQDTTVMNFSAEDSLLIDSPDFYEVIIRQEGYRTASTDTWRCAEDTATILVEFRLLKNNASRAEIRQAKRNSRKRGLEPNNSHDVSQGGFQRIRKGRRFTYTAIVYKSTKNSSGIHFVAERF